MATKYSVYQMVHQELRKTRGSATNYTCVDCPNQAQDWSYNQGGGGLPFSTNLDDYEPRCRKCHSKLDHADYECSVEECQRVAENKGMCDMHYRRVRRLGVTNLPPKPIGCSVDGCYGGHLAKGLCCKHYNRMKFTGTTDPRPQVYGCSVEGCDQKHWARGLCMKHYDQGKRHKYPDRR